MKAPAVTSVSPSRIPEVAAFTRAGTALEEWKDKYPEAAADLLELQELYNATLDAAEKVVRSRVVSSGPFDLFRFTRKDSAEVLFEAVGRQRFASFGGVIEPIEKKTIERERFDAIVAQSKLPPDVVAAVVSWTPNYRALARLVVP